VFCTCSVVPEIATTSPDVPGGWNWPPPGAAADCDAPGEAVEALLLLPPQAAKANAVSVVSPINVK
jgi:hypothetical protein